MQALEVELERLHKENEELRLLLELISKNYNILQAYLQGKHIQETGSVIATESCSSEDLNKIIARNEFRIGKASRVLVKTDVGDTSLVSHLERVHLLLALVYVELLFNLFSCGFRL